MDTAASNSPPSISPQELVSRLGKPDAPLLLDVRKPEPFAKSSHLLAGAPYCAEQDIARWRGAQLPKLSKAVGQVQPQGWTKA